MKYAVLGMYAIAIITMLALTARKHLSFNDFLLGGRNIGAWMSALSYGTTYFSAVMFVGYAGSMGYDYGISAAWVGIGNALIGSLLAWLLLAKPVRRIGEKLNVGTLPSFFEARYKSRGMRLFAALVIFIFLIPYSASVYKGLGIMFQMALGIDYTWAVIGIAMLAGLYLFAGGYKATAIVDFFQGVIMIAGVVLVVGYIISGAGGLRNGLEALGEQGGYNQLLPANEKIVPLFTNVLLTSVGVLGLPHYTSITICDELTKNSKKVYLKHDNVAKTEKEGITCSTVMIWFVLIAISFWRIHIDRGITLRYWIASACLETRTAVFMPVGATT